MSLRNFFTQNSPKEESFDFSSLPWVCQRRFAEICDGETLKNFASINESNRMLSKRCHSINKISVSCGYIRFYNLCYCKGDEYCNGLEAYQFNDKINVVDCVYIAYSKKEKLNAQFLQRLPINLNTTKCLNLTFLSADLSFIKTLITPNLKCFECRGRILLDIPIKEMKDVLANLDKLDFTMYHFRDLHSNAVEILYEFRNLNCKIILEMGSAIWIGKN